MIGAQIASVSRACSCRSPCSVPAWALPMIVASEFAQWMALSVYWVNAISVRQAIAPDRVLGRVNATMWFIAGGASRSGRDRRRAWAALIGVPLTLVVASFGMLLAFLWLMLSPVRALPRPGVSFFPSASPGDAAFGRPAFERGFGRRARAPRFNGLPPIPGWLAVHVLRDRAGALAHAHHRLRLGKTPWLAVQRAAARALDRTIYPT